MAISEKLANSLLFRRIVKSLRLPDLITAWFRSFPKVVSLPPHGIKYRVRAFESLLVEREVFASNFYAEIIAPGRVETFADLGCNRGLFSAYVISRSAAGHAVRGIMADADGEMRQDCEWIIKANNLSGVHFFQGAVGVESADGFISFEVAETDVGSHVAFDGKKAPGETISTVVRVPVLGIGKLWNETFGPRVRCNLLKVDIEGAEKDFFRIEKEFLSLVDQVIVEIHHYFAPPAAVLADAAEAGFLVIKHKPVAEGVSIACLARKIDG
ncbi:MAG: FkbM family methyltransferase [Verrucomicrobiota bacterium]